MASGPKSSLIVIITSALDALEEAEQLSLYDPAVGRFKSSLLLTLADLRGSEPVQNWKTPTHFPRYLG